MAKGLEKHRERERKLSLFGKDLTRRSRSCCELCGASGRTLEIYELGPIPAEPEYDRCLFLCPECREPLKNSAALQAERWHFLKEAVWSEERVVQALAARILDRLGRTESWAAELLEEVYWDEETEALIREEPL